MSTLKEDLTKIKKIQDGLVNNKVARFSYTHKAYTDNTVEGVNEYNVNNEQNIPNGTASIMKVNSTVLDKGYRAQASSITRMLMNHFLGRISYNLNKVNDNMLSLLNSITTNLGQANGVATLDENGHLDKEQRFPVLTEKKLKEFLFSGKEPSLKDLGLSESTGSAYNIQCVRSINEKEDIILITKYNVLTIYKYNGETLDKIREKSYPSAPTFICEYKNYALFYTFLNTSTNTQAFLTKFNFDTLELETSQITLSSSQENWICTFNKLDECFKLIKRDIKLSTTEGTYTSTKLISVDLSTFTQSETTLYIPPIVYSPGSIISTKTALSGDLLILYQTNSPIYKLCMYKVTDLTSTNNNKESLIDYYNSVTTYVVKETKNYFFTAQNANNLSVLAVDNGNFYTVKVTSNNIISNYSIQGGYICIHTDTNSNDVLTSIYKNDTLCTKLSYNIDQHVYDSIFAKGNGSTYTFIDVENNAKITNTTKMQQIMKSDRRAYAIVNTNVTPPDKFKLFEITNVLD